MNRQYGLVVSALLLSPIASAETFYISGSIGVSMVDDIASADLTSSSQPGELPEEISLNGSAFDSDEPAYGISVGWRAKDWLAVELGYTDLGESTQIVRTPFFGTTVPAPDLIEIPPVGIGFPNVIAAPLNIEGPTLGIEEWSLAAKFSKSLVSGWSANWSVGITHVQFDAEGQFTINEIVTLDPLVLNSTSIPYASPDNEVGYKFGFGFAWSFNDRFSADIGYQRHDTQVVDVESVTLQLILSL